MRTGSFQERTSRTHPVTLAKTKAGKAPQWRLPEWSRSYLLGERNMIDMEELEKMAAEAGFTHIGPLDRSTIELRKEVREMCRTGNCGAYGKKWSCPPACGSLEECGERLNRYSRGILVQTVGQLEDSLDYETMMETEAEHKEHFLKMEKMLREIYPHLLAIGAGGCTKCRECTYPDAPCRFPEQAHASMEAYGMLVLQVCKANGLTYYYGPNTIAYTSMYLLE